VQPGVAAALEAFAVAALVPSHDLHVAREHKEGAHGLVALPLAEHQVDVRFTTPLEDLHPRKPGVLRAIRIISFKSFS
jgi:hypothetical protein